MVASERFVLQSVGAMIDRNEAEEHLRVIRTLMERATIYRAISAPTALVGGVLAITIAATSLAWAQTHRDVEDIPHFVLWWLLALVLTVGANTFFIWRAAVKRSEKLFSPSLTLAVKALFPPCLVAGVITLALTSSTSDDYGLAIIWTIFYGLALLATAHFAPRSLIMLGWAFVIAGLGTFLIPFAQTIASNHLLWPRHVGASWLMGVTFGLFHLVYAATTWPRKVQ